MSKKKPREINQLLSHPTGDVQVLMDQLEKIKAINTCLQKQISPPLSNHCRAVNIRKNALVLAVDSPVWANKLRFQLTELLTFFRNNGFIGLTNIEIIVQPK